MLLNAFNFIRVRLMRCKIRDNAAKLILVILILQYLSIYISHVKADFTFGKTTVGSLTYADYGWYYKYACRFKATGSGKITKITIYTSASKVQHYAFVYSDNNGAPGTLLGSVAWTPPSSAWGWYDIEGFNVEIVKGNYYWIGLNVGSGSAAFKYDAGDTNQFAVNVDVPPPDDQFGTPKYYSYEISIYATYTTGIATRCNLESRQDTNATLNLGTITFDNVQYSLPKTVQTFNGTYQVSFTPLLGYQFQMWETSGDIIVENLTANPTLVTLFGNGTLRALYSTITLNATAYKISIDPNAHINYGLGYPVTYIFLIPENSSNLKAYRRYSLSQGWAQLEEKSAKDFFNGIECVRFDYSQNRAYVSVAFSDISDDIYICITDANGNAVPTAFLEIAKYYDNRKAAVVATGDDLDGREYVQYAFKRASDKFQASKIWVTFGIVTNNGYPPNWNDIQKQLDEGYIEVASHSRTHPTVPYPDYDSEIGGSKSDILGNLTLPSLYRRGNNEYIWAWIEPFSESDEMVRQKLGQYKYLISRTTAYPQNDFASWDSVHGTFDRIGITAVADDRTLAQLNAAFNDAYAKGQIYHFYFHVGGNSWSSTAKIPRHLDYIKNKLDVWYVGLGALYAYRYVYLNALVQSVQNS
jgi:hypothetical protein